MPERSGHPEPRRRRGASQNEPITQTGLRMTDTTDSWIAKRDAVASSTTARSLGALRQPRDDIAFDALQKSPQGLHIFHILRQLLSFRRFQDLRNFPEPAVAHDEAESVQTDLPFPDVFVAIHS